MKNALLISLCFIAGLAGANVQPILSGAGKLIFPEASPSATLSAASGALTVAAGGNNKNLILTPSGTGVAIVNASAGSSNANASLDAGGMIRSTDYNVPTAGTGLEVYAAGGNGHLQAYNRAGAAYVPLYIDGNALTINSNSGANVGIGAAPSHKLDANGDINTSGVFMKGGVAGVGTGSTITVCTSGACATSCSLIFNGGIRTGGTCP
jgi:hypothetical protein